LLAGQTGPHGEVRRSGDVSLALVKELAKGLTNLKKIFQKQKERKKSPLLGCWAKKDSWRPSFEKSRLSANHTSGGGKKNGNQLAFVFHSCL